MYPNTIEKQRTIQRYFSNQYFTDRHNVSCKHPILTLMCTKDE